MRVIILEGARSIQVCYDVNRICYGVILFWNIPSFIIYLYQSFCNLCEISKISFHYTLVSLSIPSMALHMVSEHSVATTL